MKKWVILIALLGAGFGGYSVWNNWQKSKPAANALNRPTTATVELRDISFAVNAAGEISPAEQVSVRPEINSKNDVQPADGGDPVNKRDLLFKRYDKELLQQRTPNITDMKRAKLELAKAQ